jgi:topoisomerase IV subunit B
MANDLLSSGDQSYNASSIEVLEGLEPVRKRPGMYIGGTDERALHHLVAEILDNSMDEAVAGHATRIEVELHADYAVTIRDNGRGIPDRPAPQIPRQIRAGGHPLHPPRGRQVRRRCLCHLGRPARRRRLRRQRAVRPHARRSRPQPRAFRAGILARHPQGPGHRKSAPPPTAAAPPSPSTPTTKSSARHLQTRAPAQDGPVQGLSLLRRRNPLEIRHQRRRNPAGGRFHFPGGLADYLSDQLAKTSTYADRPFAGKVSFTEKYNVPGSVEWAINWTPARDGFIQSYCNTVPTPEGGTHEGGFWAAILKGIRAYGDLVKNRKAELITRDDLLTGGCALVSCFIREPQFVGQTKDRLATEEAAKWVEGAVRDHFDNWLANDTKSAGAILDFLVLRAEERLRRRMEKETARKSATKKLRLPGKLTDCTAKSREGTELFIVEGDSAGGSAKGARDRETQALLPLKGKILNVLGAASAKLNDNSEIRDICEALGVQMGTKFKVDDLRYDKIIIMTDADVDGAHIASLLMTFFFTQMRPLIDKGHLYLACPPSTA